MSVTSYSLSEPPYALPRRRGVFVAFAPLLVLLAAGCGGHGDELTWQDLSPREQTYVEHFVVLERARAVSFVNLKLGTTLLDSLARTWGDTTGPGPDEALSEDSRRLAAVHALLEHMLTAEKDSLLNAARADRLDDPLPGLAATAP